MRTGSAVGARYRRIESLEDWLNLTGLHRKRDDLLHPSDDDDLPDPFRRGTVAIRRSVEEIDMLVTDLVNLVWPQD